MIKEVWLLVKMLFSSRPSDVLTKQIELKEMKHFPFKGFRFMCWCGCIIFRKEKKDVLERFLKTKEGSISLTHEYGHAIQAISEHGDNWSRYYLAYFWHWIKHCPWISPASACYYLNRYECEAYAQENNPDYWKNYSRKNLRTRYTIEDAKNVWKALGGTSKDWKNFLKTI